MSGPIAVARFVMYIREDINIELPSFFAYASNTHWGARDMFRDFALMMCTTSHLFLHQMQILS